jgi:hypothetical protein
LNFFSNHFKKLNIKERAKSVQEDLQNNNQGKIDTLVHMLTLLLQTRLFHPLILNLKTLSKKMMREMENEEIFQNTLASTAVYTTQLALCDAYFLLAENGFAMEEAIRLDLILSTT